MAYAVQLSKFEGPLDLLLHLIAKAKVDICDIFVSEITEQYLASMQGVDALDMDTASEFLTMAATLLEIKSRALLPRMPAPEEEGEESPEQALIRRLHEYKAIKEGAGEMQGIERAAMAVFSKLPEEYPLPPQSFQLDNLTMEGLVGAFYRMMRRVAEPEETAFHTREIERETFSIQECVFRISARLRRGPVSFTRLFSERPTRDEVVTLFMALLELLRLGRLSIQQGEVFGEIVLSPMNPSRGEAVGAE
jgi:segregation and condensation protein A